MGLDAELEWIEWVDDVMPVSDCHRILGVWKKNRSWNMAGEESSGVFRIWSYQINLVLDRQRKVKVLHIANCRVHGGVSTKGLRQKEINPFVSETIYSPCIIIIIIIQKYRVER